MRSDDYIIITDIGSTTTKGLLLKRMINDKFIFLAQYDSYTTVEEPHEDVNIGLNQVVLGLEKTSNLRLMDDRQRILYPYFTTSSAAGGLQMLLIALTPSDSGNAAKQAALCAGGVIHQELYFTDRKKEADKIKNIKSAYPDMILLAGGYEGGINHGVIRMAHLLNLAEPIPKFMPELKIPLVYCGNSKIRPFLEEALNNRFDLNFTENVRPERDTINLEPAKNLVHDLFKEKVMQRAPGFPRLCERVTKDIVPTPTAVEKIIQLYVQKNSENIIVVDMGGSTTDIYTNIKNSFKRTVAANVGLSYSMANLLESIMRDGNMDELLLYLPDTFAENDIRNYFYNKTLQPTYLPTTTSEYLLEQAAAIVGFDISWKQHIKMNFCRDYEDFFEHDPDKFFNMLSDCWKYVKKGTTGKAYREEWLFPVGSKSFVMAEIDTIIGSGGVIAYARSKEDKIMMLTEGFLPIGY